MCLEALHARMEGRLCKVEGIGVGGLGGEKDEENMEIQEDEEGFGRQNWKLWVKEESERYEKKNIMWK